MASIEKRLRNGRTTYRVRYRDPAGAQRSKVFARKVDADRWLTENESSKAHGAWVDPAAGKVLLGEWAERWYATTAALKPSTRHDYRALLDHQILPAFATVPLTAVDTLAVREWVAGLLAGGLSVKRAGKALRVLSQLLDRAVEGKRLARNVAAGITLPKRQRPEMHVLTAAEVELLASVIDSRFATLVRFAAYSGLRPSELAALKVKRLDLLRGTVRVVEAAVEVGGRLEWGSVKTHEARTVRLPRSLASEVGAHLAGRTVVPEDLVFTAALGGPLRATKFVPGYFKPALRAAGLPGTVRFYDLRHTCASLLIREGASIKAVQRQMGHATAAMTLDVYGHLFPDELDQVAERLERIRGEALASIPASGQVWPQRGPEVVPIREIAGH
jgi:integrase